MINDRVVKVRLFIKYKSLKCCYNGCNKRVFASATHTNRKGIFDFDKHDSYCIEHYNLLKSYKKSWIVHYNLCDCCSKIIYKPHKTCIDCKKLKMDGENK